MSHPLNDDNGNKVPANIRAVTYMISAVGFPIVAALLAFAVWAGWVPSPITEARDRSVATAAELNDMKSVVESSIRSQVFILRRICRNTARTPADHTECDR